MNPIGKLYLIGVVAWVAIWLVVFGWKRHHALKARHCIPASDEFMDTVIGYGLFAGIVWPISTMYWLGRGIAVFCEACTGNIP